MSDLKNTPWSVVEDEKCPWTIRILDAAGNEIGEERRWAYSTKQKTLDDVYEAAWLLAKPEREAVSAAVKAQIARVRATVEAVNTAAAKDATIAKLEAENARFRDALECLSYIHDSNPSDAMADMPELDYARHMLFEVRKLARATLEATR